MFDTVTAIVRLKSAETGRAVPLSVIIAEIGKYRLDLTEIVNRLSL